MEEDCPELQVNSRKVCPEGLAAAPGAELARPAPREQMECLARVSGSLAYKAAFVEATGQGQQTPQCLKNSQPPTPPQAVRTLPPAPPLPGWERQVCSFPQPKSSVNAASPVLPVADSKVLA